MGLFSGDGENEVSGGQVFGYILIGLAALLVVAFLIFFIVQKVGGNDKDKADNAVQVETQLETSEVESEAE